MQKSELLWSLSGTHTLFFFRLPCHCRVQQSFNLVNVLISKFFTGQIDRQTGRQTDGQNQGRIEPPKAARGHATYIDGKMLSVTKYSFQMYFRFYTCNDASAIANRWKWLISRPSVRLRRRLSVPAGNRRSLGYRRYFTAIENDRVSIRRAAVESGECSSCFRQYFR